jgi:glutathione S-transferase
MLRLVTLPVSHYCEKARWALDRAGLEYREERHVQAVHRVAARRVGGTTVPVLVTPDGPIAQSSEILAWVDERVEPDRRLFPAAPAARAEVEGLCRRLDERFGPAGRRLIYVHLLDQRPLVLTFNNVGVPRWEDRFLRYGWPLVTGVVKRALGIAPGVEVTDEKIVFDELDRVAELLSDGRPFLCGERFTAADLTFAALAAPVLAPPQYGVPLPQPQALPAKTAALVERARAHPAGRFALSLFAEHRHAIPA